MASGFVSGFVIPAKLHWNYDELTARNCQCELCCDWRYKRKAFREAYMAIFGHHRSCMCRGCKQCRQAGNAYYAAVNRLNTFSELSYLTRNEPYADGFFRWFSSEIKEDRYTDAWWQNKGDTRPLRAWLVTAARAVSGMGEWLMAC